MHFAVQSLLRPFVNVQPALQSVSGLNFTPVKKYFTLFSQALLIWSDYKESEFSNYEEKIFQE